MATGGVAGADSGAAAGGSAAADGDTAAGDAAGADGVSTTGGSAGLGAGAVSVVRAGTMVVVDDDGLGRLR